MIVAFLLTGGEARAALPVCATPPAAYAGSDATVAAITQLDIDEDQNCAAVDADVQALGTESSGEHSDLQKIDADLGTTLATSVTNWPTGGPGADVSVTNWPADQTVGLDGSTLTADSGIGEALHDDIWWVIGTLIGLFVVREILRKVWP